MKQLIKVESIHALQSKRASYVYFILGFIFLFFFYELNESMYFSPQSVHIWRQTNCLSLTQQYYQNDLPFFKPEMHNQFCDQGNSGCAVGEFPIIYYTVAQLWKLFGVHVWLFKFVQIGILFLGLFALFKLTLQVLKNIFLACFVSLLVFTSPMVIFYGPNFLPDVPALSFVFMAWLFVIKYTEQRRDHYLWIAAVMFLLSMLLKITSAISFIALGAWVIYEMLFLKESKQFFKFKVRNFIPFIITICGVVLWYWYAGYYNDTHSGHISFHGIWPIWSMDKALLIRILDVLDKIYLREMFLPTTQYITLGVWVYLLIRIRRLSTIYRFFIVILPIGFLSQLVLWFQVLEGHDYYMINLLVVFVTIWIVFLKQVEQFPQVIKNVVRFLIGVLFIVNVITCKE